VLVDLTAAVAEDTKTDALARMEEAGIDLVSAEGPTPP
jgi:hypothetical protein